MIGREVGLFIVMTLGLFLNLVVFVVQLTGARRSGKVLGKRVWVRFILYNIAYVFYLVVRVL